MAAVEQMYGGGGAEKGFYDATAIVTMAPELDPDGQVQGDHLACRLHFVDSDFVLS